MTDTAKTKKAGIKLIVGLANPGSQYAGNRHNVGGWMIEQLAADQDVSLHFETKFHGLFAKIMIDDRPCWLLEPTTYMNESGRSVLALAHFFKIKPHEILVVHDELDFDSGVVKLKREGGHGGHNGLRDIIKRLGTNTFCRMRIGIGHPGDRNKVTAYVLGDPSKDDRISIENSIDEAKRALPDLVVGNFDAAMKELHS